MKEGNEPASAVLTKLSFERTTLIVGAATEPLSWNAPLSLFLAAETLPLATTLPVILPAGVYVPEEVTVAVVEPGTTDTLPAG